jgi:hypothetical protein
MSGLLGPIVPEPSDDAKAQVAAVADPKSAKAAAFFPRGHTVPKVPAGLHRVDRPEGTLVASNPVTAAAFRNAPVVHDQLLAKLLGYNESRDALMRSMMRGGPVPHVVQGTTPKGAVVHEQMVSPGGMASAVHAAHAAVPGGRVQVTSLPAAIARRLSRAGGAS